MDKKSTSDQLLVDEAGIANAGRIEVGPTIFRSIYRIAHQDIDLGVGPAPITLFDECTRSTGAPRQEDSGRIRQRHDHTGV